MYIIIIIISISFLLKPQIPIKWLNCPLIDFFKYSPKINRYLVNNHLKYINYFVIDKIPFSLMRCHALFRREKLPSSFFVSSSHCWSGRPRLGPQNKFLRSVGARRPRSSSPIDPTLLQKFKRLRGQISVRIRGRMP